MGDQDGVITCFGMKKGEPVVSENVPLQNGLFKAFFLRSAEGVQSVSLSVPTRSVAPLVLPEIVKQI